MSLLAGVTFAQFLMSVKVGLEFKIRILSDEILKECSYGEWAKYSSGSWCCLSSGMAKEDCALQFKTKTLNKIAHSLPLSVLLSADTMSGDALTTRSFSFVCMQLCQNSPFSLWWCVCMTEDLWQDILNCKRNELALLCCDLNRIIRSISLLLFCLPRLRLCCFSVSPSPGSPRWMNKLGGGAGSLQGYTFPLLPAWRRSAPPCDFDVCTS